MNQNPFTINKFSKLLLLTTKLNLNKQQKQELK